MNIEVIDLSFQGVSQAIAAFLVETAAGPVLVETGPHSTFANLEQGLKACGYRPKDVRHVLLTHIHLDHGGAAWVFARHGASIYVHPLGVAHLRDPSRLLQSARRIYQDQMDRLWGTLERIPRELLVEVHDQEKLSIGGQDFFAWHTPGHAYHHIAWQLGDSLFTGDIAGVRIGGGLVVPPCPPPDINLEEWFASIQRIRRLRPERLYLTHFGMVQDIDKHLTKLEEQLSTWAQWMKPYSEQGKKPEEVIPAFEAFVREQLETAGITGESYQRYEFANPAWMSVAGLMRYWKKKKETG